MAEEIKTAYINSVLEWNDVYYYTYDVNGNRVSNKVINIIEGTEADHDLTIYPDINRGNNMIAATAPIGTCENIDTEVSNIEHQHYNKWAMLVNVSLFYSNSSNNYTDEVIELIRKNTGEHEMGHILGLDDIDVCCKELTDYHHGEVIMGYGDFIYRQYDVTYKDIAGASITRGFHDDNNHVWMKRTNINWNIYNKY